MSSSLYLLPDPAGVVWLGVVVAVVVMWDTRDLTGPRNRSLFAMLLPAPLLAYVFALARIPEVAPELFTAIYVTTACIAAWGAWLALRGNRNAWTPNLDHALLRALVAVLLAMNTTVVFARLPDDAGLYTNLGAQRWMETGKLPYADSLLKGPSAPGYGASATYGPLLYAAHIPAQILIGTPRNEPTLDPMDEAYGRPNPLASELTCFSFYLVGLLSLYQILARNAGKDLALGGVALFAGSPYVLGLGGTTEVVTGLAYISHIAPSAITLAAMATIRRPYVSGALLAAAAGLMFYPAFLFPLWLGWIIANKAGAVRFTSGFMAAGAVIAAITYWYTPAAEGTSAMRLFLESTLEHQEGTGLRAYGSSTLGFWGTHPGAAELWQKPVAGTWSLLKPTFIAYMALVIASFFLASRARRSVAGLAGLTVMLTAGIQLWKTHAAGSYVEWYYPFLLIALLIPAGTLSPHNAAGLRNEPASGTPLD